MARPLATASPSPTKSMTASAPLPPVNPSTLSTSFPSPSTVWCAPHSFPNSTALSERSPTFISIALDGVVRAAFLCKLQRGLGAIDDDDFRRAQCVQDLDADVAQAAGT